MVPKTSFADGTRVAWVSLPPRCSHPFARCDVDETLVSYDSADTTQRRWLIPNEEGSTTAVTDVNGAALAINTYDDYGVPAAANLGRIQYTGQKWIPDIGLYDYKVRDYSPTLGRFMQTDPVGYKSDLDLYTYVGDDPTDKTDPTGKVATCYSDGCIMTCYSVVECGGDLIYIGLQALHNILAPSPPPPPNHHEQSGDDDGGKAHQPPPSARPGGATAPGDPNNPWHPSEVDK